MSKELVLTEGGMEVLLILWWLGLEGWKKLGGGVRMRPLSSLPEAAMVKLSIKHLLTCNLITLL